MKIALISDLHQNFYKDKFIFRVSDHSEELADVDVLINAGDINHGFDHAVEDNNDIEEDFKSVNKNGVYFKVFGNHDFMMNPRKLKSEIYLNRISNVGLEKRPIQSVNQRFVKVLEGVTIIGCTLWTPVKNHIIPTFSDYVYVPEFNPRLTSNGTENRNKAYELDWHWLMRQIKVSKEENPDNKIIVVTHHVPLHELACKGPGIDNFYDPYFVNVDFRANNRILGMNKLIDVWCCGHTHYFFDRTINDIRFVCNPRGYPEERTDIKTFKPYVFEA